MEQINAPLSDLSWKSKKYSPKELQGVLLASTLHTLNFLLKEFAIKSEHFIQKNLPEKILANTNTYHDTITITFLDKPWVQIYRQSSVKTLFKLQVANFSWDRIKGLKLWRIYVYCGGAPVHEASQYTREKKSLSCTVVCVLRP